MSNKTKVLYIGMTNNLTRRMYEYKNKINPGFTAKYNVDQLVYYEEVENELAARRREKQLKRWLREKKIKLIKSMNPVWKDLADFVDGIMEKNESS